MRPLDASKYRCIGQFIYNSRDMLLDHIINNAVYIPSGIIVRPLWIDIHEKTISPAVKSLHSIIKYGRRV